MFHFDRRYNGRGSLDFASVDTPTEEPATVEQWTRRTWRSISYWFALLPLKNRLFAETNYKQRERERERERGRGWVLVSWRVWYTQPVSENASALTSIVRYGVQGNPLYIYACIIEAKKWNEEELWMHLSKHERDNEIGWMLIIFYYVWYPSSIRYILRYLTRQLAMRYRLFYVPQTTWENL